MVRLRRLGVGGFLLLAACSPTTEVVATADTGTTPTDAATTSSTADATSSDTSTTATMPEPMRFATLALDDERLCAIAMPDGRIVCRDIAQCDAGRDPSEWDLASPECWRDSLLPDAEYAMLAMFDNQMCGLRADSGSVECDYPTPPEGSGYVDIALSSFGACATDGAYLDCGYFGTAVGLFEVDALDGHLALTPDGVTGMANILGCVDSDCIALDGAFVDVFGPFDLAQTGCGLQGDGTVLCTDDHEPIDDARAVAQVELRSAGPRCVRFESGEVECTFEPAPPFADFVEIAMSATPAFYACGIRTDGTMACWGESFDWCGQYLCVGVFECIDEQCYDCTEGCEPCGAMVCQGQTCIDGACVTCDIPPCVACGDDICNGNQDCLDDACFFCGDRPCPACGDTYCDIYHECVDGECV